jgi:hypothetical protein
LYSSGTSMKAVYVFKLGSYKERKVCRQRSVEAGFMFSTSIRDKVTK